MFCISHRRFYCGKAKSHPKVAFYIGAPEEIRKEIPWEEWSRLSQSINEKIEVLAFVIGKRTLREL